MDRVCHSREAFSEFSRICNNFFSRWGDADYDKDSRKVIEEKYKISRQEASQGRRWGATLNANSQNVTCYEGKTLFAVGMNWKDISIFVVAVIGIFMLGVFLTRCLCPSYEDKTRIRNLEKKLSESEFQIKNANRKKKYYKEQVKTLRQGKMDENDIDISEEEIVNCIDENKSTRNLSTNRDELKHVRFDRLTNSVSYNNSGDINGSRRNEIEEYDAHKDAESVQQKLLHGKSGNTSENFPNVKKMIKSIDDRSAQNTNNMTQN